MSAKKKPAAHDKITSHAAATKAVKVKAPTRCVIYKDLLVPEDYKGPSIGGFTSRAYNGAKKRARDAGWEDDAVLKLGRQAYAEAKDAYEKWLG